MPTYRHPLADADTPGLPPSRVHVSRADKRAVSEDGSFEAPRHVADAIADRFDTTAEAMRADGEAAGDREATPEVDEAAMIENGDADTDPGPDGNGPEDLIDRGVCPWCDDYEGDHVGRHASSAHPDEWAAYQEDA